MDGLSKELEKEVDVLYSLWLLALKRKEWFRDARKIRMRLEERRANIVKLNKV